MTDRPLKDHEISKWKPAHPSSMSDASLPQHATHHLVVHMEKDVQWTPKAKGGYEKTSTKKALALPMKLQNNNPHPAYVGHQTKIHPEVAANVKDGWDVTSHSLHPGNREYLEKTLKHHEDFSKAVATNPKKYVPYADSESNSIVKQLGPAIRNHGKEYK